MRKLVFLVPLLLAGCATTGQPRFSRAARLVNALGAPIGSVLAWQTAAGVTFRIDASGLPPGVHGLHVHAVGRCDPPGFTSAGGHWNPTGRKHGFANPLGHHEGDLPNLTVGSNGAIHTSVTLPGATLASGSPTGLLDADGAALVIHATADDYRSDPSGDSGARIACAVIQPAG